MENCEKPVQNNKKKLSRSNKVGRHKYNQQLLKRAQKDIEEIKLTQRTILSGLKDFFHFKQPIIEKIACLDEVDRDSTGTLRSRFSRSVAKRPCNKTCSI